MIPKKKRTKLWKRNLKSPKLRKIKPNKIILKRDKNTTQEKLLKKPKRTRKKQRLQPIPIKVLFLKVSWLKRTELGPQPSCQDKITMMSFSSKNNRTKNLNFLNSRRKSSKGKSFRNRRKFKIIMKWTMIFPIK